MHMDESRVNMKFQFSGIAFSLLMLACAALLALPANAQPAPGPGGGGPGDPPRSTPELDPATLSVLATASYFGFQSLKARRK